MPVLEDSNDPLTRKIADFLDQKFGLSTNHNSTYGNQCYKVGIGGCRKDSSGMTIYGKTSSLDEMKALADEIETKFGKELQANIKRYNLQQRDLFI